MPRRITAVLIVLALLLGQFAYAKAASRTLTEQDGCYTLTYEGGGAAANQDALLWMLERGNTPANAAQATVLGLAQQRADSGGQVVFTDLVPRRGCAVDFYISGKWLSAPILIASAEGLGEPLTATIQSYGRADHTEVRLYDELNGDLVWSGVPESMGGLTIAGALPGNYRLTVNKRGYLPWEQVLSTGLVVIDLRSLAGDVTGDGVRDGADLTLLLEQYGTDDTGDLNDDGTVNFYDLQALLSQPVAESTAGQAVLTRAATQPDETGRGAATFTLETEGTVTAINLLLSYDPELLELEDPKGEGGMEAICSAPIEVEGQAYVSVTYYAPAGGVEIATATTLGTLPYRLKENGAAWPKEAITLTQREDAIAAFFPQEGSAVLVGMADGAVLRYGEAPADGTVTEPPPPPPVTEPSVDGTPSVSGRVSEKDGVITARLIGPRVDEPLWQAVKKKLDKLPGALVVLKAAQGQSEARLSGKMLEGLKSAGATLRLETAAGGIELGLTALAEADDWLKLTAAKDKEDVLSVTAEDQHGVLTVPVTALVRQTERGVYIPCVQTTDTATPIVQSAETDGWLWARVNSPAKVTCMSVSTQFSDMEGSGNEAAVNRAAAKGLARGVGPGRFEPEAPLTRGALAVLLYRLEGEPHASGVLPALDQTAIPWYADAAARAAALGLFPDVEGATFDPDVPVTSKELAAVLRRYLAETAPTLSPAADTQSASADEDTAVSRAEGVAALERLITYMVTNGREVAA